MENLDIKQMLLSTIKFIKETPALLNLGIVSPTITIRCYDFAGKHTRILKEDFDLIQHARRPLFFDDEEPWVKKQEEIFDVTMRAYDDANLCVITVYCLCSAKITIIRKSVYIDGLSFFKNINGPEARFTSAGCSWLHLSSSYLDA